jgi:hypothetical protein
MFLVTKQDVCRFYKEDFWGELIRVRDYKKHLNRVVFGKPFKSRRARRNYRSTKFEVIKMDNRRYKKRRRIPKSVIRHHNIEKVRLYYCNIDEFGVRAFIMLQRDKFNPGKKFAEDITVHDRLGYRLDHIIFLLNWASTLSDARRRITAGYYQVNRFIPKRYDFVPVVGDELLVRPPFKQLTFRHLKKLRFKRLLNFYNLNKARYTAIWSKKRRRKMHKLHRRWTRKQMIKRYFSPLKVVRQRFLRMRDKANRGKNLNLKRWKRAKRSRGFFPRAFLPISLSIPNKRIFSLFHEYGDYASIGPSSIYNSSFIKPAFDWQAKFGKFFFNQFLERYNGQFYLYKNVNYYQDEGIAWLDHYDNPLSNQWSIGIMRLNFMSKTTGVKTLTYSVNNNLYDFVLPDIEHLFGTSQIRVPTTDLVNFFIKSNPKYQISNQFEFDRFLIKFKFMAYSSNLRDSPIYRTLLDHFTYLKTDVDLNRFGSGQSVRFSPIYTAFYSLQNLIPIIEKRVVFNQLWSKLYLARLKRSNFILDAVARLASDEKSVFYNVISRRLRYKMYMARFSNITKNFANALPIKARSGNIPLLTPSLSPTQNILPTSLAKVVADFFVPVTMAQDRSFMSIADWIDGYLNDLAVGMVVHFPKTIYSESDLNKSKYFTDLFTKLDINALSRFTPALQIFLTDKLLKPFFLEKDTKVTTFDNYFINNLPILNSEQFFQLNNDELNTEKLNPISTITSNKNRLNLIEAVNVLSLMEAREVNLKIRALNLRGIEDNNIELDLLNEKKSIIDKRMFYFKVLTNRFVQSLSGLDTYKNEYFSKPLLLQKKFRSLNKVFKPKFRRIKKKRRRTLLLRNFNNLFVSYRLLKLIFIGYRRIRRKFRPFFYFPCKFSFKPFLKHYGSKRKLKRVNKKDAVYVQKPRLPFNLPKLNKKKFGMTDLAQKLDLPVKPKRNHVKYAKSIAKF